MRRAPPPHPALRALLRTAEAQVELSVLERSFLEVPPSVVAYAALLNAATCLARTAEERPSPFLLADFGTALERGGLVALPSSRVSLFWYLVSLLQVAE